jgi:hypothetical protein
MTSALHSPGAVPARSRAGKPERASWRSAFILSGRAPPEISNGVCDMRVEFTAQVNFRHLTARSAFRFLHPQAGPEEAMAA